MYAVIWFSWLIKGLTSSHSLNYMNALGLGSQTFSWKQVFLTLLWVGVCGPKKNKKTHRFLDLVSNQKGQLIARKVKVYH